jgi:hypothetical protein
MPTVLGVEELAGWIAGDHLTLPEDDHAGYVHQALEAQIERGRLLHGTTATGLTTIEARRSEYEVTDAESGEPKRPPKAVYATHSAQLAIFYATVHRPAFEAGLKHGAAMRYRYAKAEKDYFSYRLGRAVGGCEFFVSPEAKQLVRARERSGIAGRVYVMEPVGFEYDPATGEWMSPDEVPVVGELAVSTQCFALDIFDLSSPLDDPHIRATYNLG